MAKYIDAEKLKITLIDKYSFLPAFVVRAIEEAPAADVVEVVRCKDCKYAEQSEADEHYYNCSNYFGCSQHEKHYCADGERVEND